MTKKWIEKRVGHLAGLLDNTCNVDAIKERLLRSFGYDVVSNIVDNLNYLAVTRGRYTGHYKAMLPDLTMEILRKYKQVGLSRGMPPVVCESGLEFYRRQSPTNLSLPPSLGFYLHGRIQFKKLLRAGLDSVRNARNIQTTVILGTRWPDVYRNWSHSVLFISDHVHKEVFIMDPANEDQWEFQTKAIAKYWETKELNPWKVVKKLCPKQRFAGDCNIVTLMIVDMMSEGKDIPAVFSKEDIKKYKSKLVALLISRLN